MVHEMGLSEQVASGLVLIMYLSCSVVVYVIYSIQTTTEKVMCVRKLMCQLNIDFIVVT